MCAFLPREEWGYGPLLHKLIDAGEELFVKELRAGQQQQEFLVLEGGEGGREGGSEMRGKERGTKGRGGGEEGWDEGEGEIHGRKEEGEGKEGGKDR